MDDAIGHAEAMLGLDGFRVLDVDRKPAEMTVTVETTAEVAGCPTCGVRAEAQDRLRVDIRDLPEDTEHVAPRAVLTLRAGAEATPPRRRTGHAGGGRRPRACRVLVDGDERGGPPRHPPSSTTRSGWGR